jgi:hypothetical protein
VAPGIGSDRVQLGRRRGHLNGPADSPGSRVDNVDSHDASFCLSDGARSRLGFAEGLAPGGIYDVLELRLVREEFEDR